jgi:L-fuconolactonase
MRVDAHQHFWKYNAVRDTWMTDDMSVLKNDYLPNQLAKELKNHNIDGCISVQSGQSESETLFLNELAKNHNWIFGIVGWIDLQGNNIEERLEYFSSFKKIKGWRHIIQSEAPGFIARSSFRRGIKVLSKYDFTYDILIYPNQIAEATNLVKQFPNQKFVVDHLAKPPIAKGEIEYWLKAIQSLSECPNVHCKLSGMVTEAKWQAWKEHEFIPYLDAIVNYFGTQRLMYGSDWPVCLLSATYGAQLKMVEEYFSSFSQREQFQIFGDNACKFYSLC